MTDRKKNGSLHQQQSSFQAPPPAGYPYPPYPYPPLPPPQYYYNYYQMPPHPQGPPMPNYPPPQMPMQSP